MPKICSQVVIGLKDQSKFNNVELLDVTTLADTFCLAITFTLLVLTILKLFLMRMTALLWLMV